mmetsp:Transcript_17340/g.23194  ORF Transcript_17340/g.23194 Transcript_17340/m.23194 type:complete len:194 (+) Transcript_17340:2014-2595(+)
MNMDGCKETIINKFLRLIDVCISFPDGSCLLVSENEADSILQCFWDSPDGIMCSSCYFHYSLVSRAIDKGSLGQRCLLALPAKSQASQDIGCKIPIHTQGQKWCIDISNVNVLTSVRLFAGETTYCTDSQKDVLKAMLLGEGQGSGIGLGVANGGAERVVEMRGLIHLLPYSDLEQICIQCASAQLINCDKNS